METDPMARKKAGEGQGGSTRAQGGAKKPSKRPKRSGDLINHRQMQALAKKERVRMLAIFCERVASPKEVSEELQEGLSQVSYHVGVLRECRLIVLDHKVRRRGAVEHFYRAAAPTLVPPNAWDNLPPAARKTISLSILQEFFDDATASLDAGTFDASPGELSWTPLILDSLGVEEFGQLARDFLESVLSLQKEASKRLAQGNGTGANATSATVFLASFLSARSPEEGKKASASKRR